MLTLALCPFHFAHCPQLFDRNAMMINAYKNKKIRRTTAPSPDIFTASISFSPNASRRYTNAGNAGNLSPVGRMSSLSPNMGSRRLRNSMAMVPTEFGTGHRQSILQGGGGQFQKRQSIVQGGVDFSNASDRVQQKRASIIPGGIMMQDLAGGLADQKRTSIIGAHMVGAKRTSIIPGGRLSPPTVAPPGQSNPLIDDEDEQQKLEMMLKINERRLKMEALNSQAASLLFSNVDYKEKGEVTWDEFTSYIVEGFQDTVVSKEETLRPYLPTNQLNTSYNKELSKIFEIDEIGEHGSLVITEQASRSFKIFTPDKFEDLNTLRPSMWTEVKGHDGDVLSVGHIPELGYLVTSSTDCTIQFWDEQDYHLCQRLPVPAPILTTEWAPSYKNNKGFGGGGAGVLFPGGLKNPRTGLNTITGYDPSKSFTPVTSMNMHTDTILDLYSIPSLHTLVSCGMDAKICMWDLQTSQFKKTLIGHTKGVLDIDYSQDYRLLASAGFDHDVLVWNPHVSSIIARLKGHMGALIGVKMSGEAK